MKVLKPSCVCCVIFLMGGFNLSAQSTLGDGKALNFPAQKYGISIGNSHEFTGIRINFADENGDVKGGHLYNGEVFAAEVVIFPYEKILKRKFDEITGLKLWNSL